MFKAKVNDPEYQRVMAEIQRLNELLAAFINPACHWNTAQAVRRGELTEPDRMRAIQRVRDDLARLVGRDEYDDLQGPFARYVASLDVIELPDFLIRRPDDQLRPGDE